MNLCKASYMAIRKSSQGKKIVSENQVTTYYFGVAKVFTSSDLLGINKETMDITTLNLADRVAKAI